MEFLTDMITEIKLAGKVPVRTAALTLQVAEKAAAVLFFSVFGIFTDAFTVITAADPVFFVILIDDVAGTVVEKSYTFSAVFYIQRFGKILKFILMYASRYIKGCKAAPYTPVCGQFFKEGLIFFFVIDLYPEFHGFLFSGFLQNNKLLWYNTMS